MHDRVAFLPGRLWTVAIAFLQLVVCGRSSVIFWRHWSLHWLSKEWHEGHAFQSAAFQGVVAIARRQARFKSFLARAPGSRECGSRESARLPRAF